MTDRIEYETDDERLSAYIDGELPDDDAEALTARLAAEPALMQRLEALRGTDAAVRDVYAQVDSTPMPASVLGLFDTAEAKTETDNVVAFPARGIRRFFEMPVALAASVALLAGFFGANLLRQDVVSPPAGAALVAGEVASGTALYALLESTPSGESLDLGGNAAEVLLTFEDVNGDWCRQLRVVEPARSVHGVACRRDAGWQLETVALGELGAPGGQFGTAAGTTPAAVDTAVDTLLGAGEPLENEEEKSTISKGWKKSAE